MYATGRGIADSTSRRSELSLSCICMVSDVRDMDIRGFAKKLDKGARVIWMAEN